MILVVEIISTFIIMNITNLQFIPSILSIPKVTFDDATGHSNLIFTNILSHWTWQNSNQRSNQSKHQKHLKCNQKLVQQSVQIQLLRLSNHQILIFQCLKQQLFCFQQLEYCLRIQIILYYINCFMIQDSPFHTSINLFQKVRHSINNREPPSSASTGNLFQRSKNNNQHLLQNTHQFQRSPVISRPSLQHIKSPKDYEYRPSIQSCKQIQSPKNQYYLESNKNPCMNPFKDRNFKNRVESRPLEASLDLKQHILSIPFDNRQKAQREQNPFIKKQQERLFKIQDFQDQLNEILKDQFHAMQLLEMIQPKQQMRQQIPSNDFDISSFKLYKEKQGEKQFQSDFENLQKFEQLIDFDALRQEQLRQISCEQNRIYQKLPVISEQSSKFPVAEKIAEKEQNKMFLLSEGQVSMKRYTLSN